MYVLAPIAHALDFLHCMFQARKYNMKTKSVISFDNVMIRDNQNRLIFAVLLPPDPIGLHQCLPIPEHSQISQIDDISLDVERSTHKGPGIEFTKIFVPWCVQNKIHIFIIICNPKQANIIRRDSRVTIQVFTYLEALTPLLKKHSFQPRRCELASREEQESKNRKELSRFPMDDALMKFLGWKEGNMVKCVDQDRQCGSYTEFSMIVRP